MTPRWRFRVVDSLCEPGGSANEDRATALPQAAWVLDGTTGHHPVRLFPGPTDAAWFAETADGLLRELAGQVVGTRMLLDDLVRRLVEECRRSALNSLDAADIDKPAASLALVQLIGDDVEYAMLSDCKLLMRRHDGTVEALDRSAISDFEDQLIAALQALQAAGETDVVRTTQKLWPMILANRRRKNLPGGYGVLADDPACVAFADVACRPAAALSHVMLASDGFYRLVDTYGVYSASELLDQTTSGGVAPLYAMLRQIEDADPQCLKHPRIKPRDDAAALLLRLDRA